MKRKYQWKKQLIKMQILQYRIWCCRQHIDSDSLLVEMVYFQSIDQKIYILYNKYKQSSIIHVRKEQQALFAIVLKHWIHQNLAWKRERSDCTKSTDSFNKFESPAIQEATFENRLITTQTNKVIIISNLILTYLL